MSIQKNRLNETVFLDTKTHVNTNSSEHIHNFTPKSVGLSGNILTGYGSPLEPDPCITEYGNLMLPLPGAIQIISRHVVHVYWVRTISLHIRHVLVIGHQRVHIVRIEAGSLDTCASSLCVPRCIVRSLGIRCTGYTRRRLVFRCTWDTPCNCRHVLGRIGRSLHSCIWKSASCCVHVPIRTARGSNTRWSYRVNVTRGVTGRLRTRV